MSERIDLEAFYAALDRKGGKLKLGVLASQMGVSTRALADMLDGKFRIGLFALNVPACSAFFSACAWLGVPASSFLVEERHVTE